MTQVTEVIKIRRRVLTEVAKLAFGGKLVEGINNILYTVATEDGPRYRCCVHKERAVLRERIYLALGQSSEVSLEQAAEQALAGNESDIPVINVLPEACDQCPIDKFIITNACRNCLAHHCIASCPKQAIMVVQNQAYIDKSKCVECGLCKKSCPYGAIIEVNRPCENACHLDAITADKNRRAKINYDRCVQCGSCKTACPFGAVSEKSSIVQVITRLNSSAKVIAVIAPAFIGQFGAKVNPSQVISALRSLGFYEVYEASKGADIVTVEEAQEFVHSVPNEREFMTTSCCPSFVDMINKHFPEFKQNVSTVLSPMVVTGKMVKDRYPDATVVFIGPCIAKKAEARKYSSVIDYVLTFEELTCMMVGAGINVALAETNEFTTQASHDGNRFAVAGGVTQAVKNLLGHAHDSNVALKPHHSDGLDNCKNSLLQLKSGKLDINFLEGMACSGGCVGGPGVLTNPKVTSKLIDNYAKTSSIVTVNKK